MDGYGGWVDGWMDDGWVDGWMDIRRAVVLHKSGGTTHSHVVACTVHRK